MGNPDSTARILLVHGAGGNSAAMWPYATHLAQLEGCGHFPVEEPGFTQLLAAVGDLLRTARSQVRREG